MNVNQQKQQKMKIQKKMTCVSIKIKISDNIV